MLPLRGAVTPRQILRDSKTHLVPNARFLLKGPQRRRGVQLPVAPCLSSDAVLKEHADDLYHGQ